jgi:hypothetical protein
MLASAVLQLPFDTLGGRLRGQFTETGRRAEMLFLLLIHDRVQRLIAHGSQRTAARERTIRRRKASPERAGAGWPIRWLSRYSCRGCGGAAPGSGIAAISQQTTNTRKPRPERVRAGRGFPFSADRRERELRDERAAAVVDRETEAARGHYSVPFRRKRCRGRPGMSTALG